MKTRDPQKILLILSGSIAAYKIPELVRLLTLQSIAVTPVLTHHALDFVTPLTLTTLSHQKVYMPEFSLTEELEMSHITLARSPDLVLVAPATAHFIAKMAQGLADDLATTLLLATDKPIMVAPAMNTQMWYHPATQRNLAQIQADGVLLLPPAEGLLACQESGIGKMMEVPEMVKRVQEFLLR